MLPVKVAVFLMVLLFSLCCKKVAPSAKDIQTGTASWYGKPFDGRLTANGEVYDMEKMTAAHRTLPFGTIVRVRRLDNDKMAEVRINDRGPFVRDRIIDLSHAAAQTLSMTGIAPVSLLAIRTPPTRSADMFAVQVGAFAERSEAESVRSRLQIKYGVATLTYRDRDRTWWVLVGLKPTVESADTLASQLDDEHASGFVVRIDSPQ